MRSAPTDEARAAIVTAVTLCVFGVQPTAPNAQATDVSVAGPREIASTVARVRAKD